MSDFPIQPAAAQIQVPRLRLVRVPMVGKRSQLTNVNATYYTAPTINASLPTKVTDMATACVKGLVLTNTDTAARTVTLYCVESGGSAADNRARFKDLSIAAKTTAEYSYGDDEWCLASAETVQALADVTLKVTIELYVQVLMWTA